MARAVFLYKKDIFVLKDSKYLNGYKLVYLPNHHRASSLGGYVYEHIIVVEEKLGRPIVDGGVIHHLDKNRSNNIPDNLIVFKSMGDHTRFHSLNENKDLLQKMDDGTYICLERRPSYICDNCGIEFSVYYKRKCDHTYCSMKCSGESTRRVEQPSKEELEKLIWEIPTSKLADLYGLSDKAIEKWCKKYDIQKPPRGYWMKNKIVHS